MSTSYVQPFIREQIREAVQRSRMSGPGDSDTHSKREYLEALLAACQRLQPLLNPSETALKWAGIRNFVLVFETYQSVGTLHDDAQAALDRLT